MKKITVSLKTEIVRWGRNCSQLHVNKFITKVIKVIIAILQLTELLPTGLNVMTQSSLAVISLSTNV